MKQLYRQTKTERTVYLSLVKIKYSVCVWKKKKLRELSISTPHLKKQTNNNNNKKGREFFR